MPRAGLLALLVAIGGLLAVPAAAKEGVRAKLDRPVRLGTAPGKTIRVAWHLVGDRARPSSASRIYLRVSRCGRKPMRIPAVERAGGFSASLKVPKGGIRKLLVGLKGWRITGESRERADALFPFDPPLHRRCPSP
jgi:hypothetical protein